MGANTAIDLERISQLHSEGMSMGGIAKELGVARSTISRHLQRPNGHAANGDAAAQSEARPSNGHAVANGAELEALRELLAARFSKLTLAEQVTFFLDRD